MLYPGTDPGGAVARATGATKVPAEDLSPLTIRQLVEGQPPRLEGPGSLTTCAAAPTDLQSLRDNIARAQRSLAYLDYEQTVAGLRSSETLIGCLKEPLDGTVAGRLYFLLGLSLFNQGQLADAKAAFRRAHVFQPGMPWDDYYAPKGKPLFEEAAKEVAALVPVSVQLVPSPAPEAVWIDGKPSAILNGNVLLLPGAHVFQVATPSVLTMTVTVEPMGGTKLIIPAAIPSDALPWVADPSKQSQLSSVLGTVLPAGSTVYISSGTSIWQGTIGDPVWVELEVPTGFLSAMGGKRGKFVAGQTLFWTGGISAVGGGALTVVSLLQRNSAQRDGERAESWDSYTEAEGRYGAAVDRSKVGAVVLAGGAVLAGVGGLISYTGGKAKVTPTVSTTEVGATFHWAW